MSHRERWTFGLFAGVGAGVCAAGLALLLMTGLDRALPTEAVQPVAGQIHSMAEDSLSQGATIGLFLMLSVVLIAIALGASAADRGCSRDPGPGPRHAAFREVNAVRILAQRQ